MLRRRRSLPLQTPTSTRLTGCTRLTECCSRRSQAPRICAGSDGYTDVTGISHHLVVIEARALVDD